MHRHFVRSARVVATSYKSLTSQPKEPYDKLLEADEFKPEQVTKLDDVVVEGEDSRRSASDRVLYELAGGGFHDLFVASWGYDWARAKGFGHSFDLSA